jgi:subtilase family serine protease
MLLASIQWPAIETLAEGYNENDNTEHLGVPGVDLAIHSVSVRANPVDQSVFLSGRETRTCVTVVNQGRETAHQVRFFFAADGGIILPIELDDLLPGGALGVCEKVLFPWETTEASAVVYSEETALDYDPANNRVSMAPVKATSWRIPDGYIERPRMVEHPNRLYALRRGEPVFICTTVGNRGPGDLRDVEVRFVTYGDNPVTLLSRRIDEMTPDDSTDICGQVTIPEDSLRFIAGVYPNDWSEEASRSDNVVEYEFATRKTYGGGAAPDEDESLLLADLRIARFQIEGGSCTSGRNGVLVTVRNDGEGPSRRSSVGLLIDQGEALNKSVDRLEPGEQQTVRFERDNLSAGPHTLWAAADFERQVDESSEVNNEDRIAVTCEAAVADLEVDTISLDDDDCRAGKNRVRVTVRNEGTAKAERFLVRLFVNNAEVDDGEMDDIPPDEERRIRFNRVELASGSNTIIAQADVRDVVPERNESNNRLAVGFTCAATQQRNG